jgi:hypothetical protein
MIRVCFAVFLVLAAAIRAQTTGIPPQAFFSVPDHFEVFHRSEIRGSNTYDSSIRRLDIHSDNDYPLTRPPTRPPAFSETLLHFGNRGRDRIFSDFGNLYRRDNVWNYGIVLAGAGILANTKIDRHFQNWYNDDVHCNFTKELSEFTKIFGEGQIFIPVVVSTAVIYRFRQERLGRVGEEKLIGNFFDRTARGYAVGTPTLITAQILLGADRPRAGTSYWRPFQKSHGVSGHAFIGAVPFITAAQMTDKIWAKGLFYSLSVLPGWSRVNDDAHYLSQVLLGWSLAYLSVQAVSETEKIKPNGFIIYPVLNGNSIGFGFIYRR